MRILFNKIFLLSLLILVGCSKSEEDSNVIDNTPSINSIQISVSSAEVTVGTTILFTVFDNTGKNRTSEAKFYVDETEISGSSYTFNDVGTYEVYAKYQNIKSQTENIVVNPTPIEYKQYVLVEDFTGTWCGYCTRVSYAIEQVEKQTDDAIIIAIHSGNSSTRYDPFHFAQVGTLMNAFSVSGYPYGLIDRKSRWTPPEPGNISEVTEKLTKKAYAALAMESSLDGDMLTIKVKLKMGYNYKALKLGLYILEDGLVYDQANWTTYYDGDPLKDYVHNHVLRKSITGLLGDQIPSDKVGHDKVFEKEFQYVIPSEFKKENVKMVAFVTEASKKETINVRVSKIGESQDFEK
jgi:thiol-disulfide isomerase/thioredoxin